jgi:hypothetical protein
MIRNGLLTFIFLSPSIKFVNISKSFKLIAKNISITPTNIPSGKDKNKNILIFLSNNTIKLFIKLFLYTLI